MSHLNDSSRILANLFHTISSVRKNFIYPLVNTKFKDIGEKVTSGEFLFGANLGEKIREFKTLETTGKGLKATYSSQAKAPFFKVPANKHQPRQGQASNLLSKQPLNKTRPTRQAEGPRQTSSYRGRFSRKEPYNRHTRR